MIPKLEDIQSHAIKNLYRTGAIELPSTVIEHELTLGLYISLQELILLLGYQRCKLREPENLSRIAYLYSIKKLPLREIARRMGTSRHTVGQRLKEMNIEVIRPSRRGSLDEPQKGITEKTRRRRFSMQVKVKANFQCEECGSTELLQAHDPTGRFIDPNDGICLCADCHSKKHPNVPRALFFQSGSGNPYWHNRSIGSLARELGVHPRTISRAAKRLGILPGELSPEDEQRIRETISIHMAVLNSKRYGYLTTSHACERLELSRHQLVLRIQRGIFPTPTFVDAAGIRYFDEEWVKRVQAIQERPKTVPPHIELRVIAVTEKDGKQALVCELDYDGDKELLPEWLRQKIEVQT